MEIIEGKKYFKAIVRVIKSLNHETHEFRFGTEEAFREPIIEAENKDEVKSFLMEKYPQFFPNGKVYERETKDVAQFFYVVIYPLFSYEIEQVKRGEWICSSCGHVHENMYVSKPHLNERLFGRDVLFCNSSICEAEYSKKQFAHIETGEDLYFIKKDSPNYIYRCIEKSTGKSYVGKTRNEPFFRWWNHFKHSSSPFGLYLRSTVISDWTFEVLEILPADTLNSEVLRIESEYMIKFDSIKNGFNTLISNKSVMDKEENKQQQLIDFPEF